MLTINKRLHHHPLELNGNAQNQLQSPDLSQKSREQVKHALRNGIRNSLELARTLSPEESVPMIRKTLFDLQMFCRSIGKNFIFVEEQIGCNQYDLGGPGSEGAILFRGPDKRATVAICVTQKGSLLYRNESTWEIYCDAGDIAPAM